jgi:hypothetical protein
VTLCRVLSCSMKHRLAHAPSSAASHFQCLSFSLDRPRPKHRACATGLHFEGPPHACNRILAENHMHTQPCFRQFPTLPASVHLPPPIPPPPSVLKMLLALYQTAIGALLDRFSGERGRPPDPYAGDGQRTLRRPRPQRTKASESQNPPIVLYHRHKRKNQSGNPFYFNWLERKPGD